MTMRVTFSPDLQTPPFTPEKMVTKGDVGASRGSGPPGFPRNVTSQTGPPLEVTQGDPLDTRTPLKPIVLRDPNAAATEDGGENIGMGGVEAPKNVREKVSVGCIGVEESGRNSILCTSACTAASVRTISIDLARQAFP